MTRSSRLLNASRIRTPSILYKLARTRDIVAEGLKEADAGFVGLPDMPAAMSFEEQFCRTSGRGWASAPTVRGDI